MISQLRALAIGTAVAATAVAMNIDFYRVTVTVNQNDVHLKHDGLDKMVKVKSVHWFPHAKVVVAASSNDNDMIRTSWHRNLVVDLDNSHQCFETSWILVEKTSGASKLWGWLRNSDGIKQVYHDRLGNDLVLPPVLVFRNG